MLLKNVKSNYILIQIFSPLERVKCEMIRYNKKLKARLGITIDYYKELYKKYNTIEVDVILDRKHSLKHYDILPFIKSNYIHVYTEDKNEEITENNAKDNKKSYSKIKLIIDPDLLSLKELFYKFNIAQEINFTKCKRKDILDMSYMFGE